MKLGSLFDGSGGFPLAGALCGIEPVWASEVEPYPIAVTRSRFPNMRHLGDISKVHGGEIEPVDIITFGSPCQDLSVAGKRAGLKHEANGDEETTRSGLFMEAVRIIKEMRAATNGMYPTFALWENVPGAFSSNGGEDFRIVCEELIKIVEPSAVMPPVPQNGWAYADSYVGDGWSLAYRVFDAQYWGVPQRRRRIHLVLDLRGERAREILFEREGVRGYFAQSGETRQGTPADAERSTGADDREGEGNGDNRGRRLDELTPIMDSVASNSMKSANPHSGCREVEVSKTLDTSHPDPSKNQGGIAIVQPIAKEQYLFENHSQDTRYKGPLDVSPMLPAQLGTGGNNTPFVVESAGINGDIAGTLDASYYKGCGMSTGRNGVIECRKVYAIDHVITTGGNCTAQGPCYYEGIMPTLKASGVHGVCIPIHDQATRFAGKRGDKSDGKGNGLGVGQEGDPMNTLTGGDPHLVAFAANQRDEVRDIGDKATALQAQPGMKQQTFVCQPPQYIVRRLIPTECARLQGFADWWAYIEPKTALTEEEYNFWLEVRSTHAAINGKKVQDYTKPQMLTWYNKLHTDSAEYKMWGNGIALPPALYVMQGIADALYHALVRANLPEHCMEE